MSATDTPARISGATTITLSALVGLLTSGAGLLVNYGTQGADVRHVAGQQEQLREELRATAAALRDEQRASEAKAEATRDRVTSLEARMQGIDQALGRIEGYVSPGAPRTANYRRGGR